MWTQALSKEYHQMEWMDYIVVELVSPAEGDENTELATDLKSSNVQHSTLDNISIELLLNTNWWMILTITVKFWSLNVQICIVTDKDAISPFLCESEIRSVVSDSWQLYSPWDSPSQNTEVGSLSFLQGFFPTQGWNPGLLHCRRILYQLSQEWSPRILEWVAFPFSSISSWPRNRTRVSCIAGGFFTNWAIRGAHSFLWSSYNLKWNQFLCWIQYLVLSSQPQRQIA